ncbi:MAG TPA: hypothetical protein VH186_00675 [Chloroflexia bacterium]|nr:hypothetical protein [Chloroflexia bacterium]
MAAPGDRREPGKLERNPPEEPNEYAIRYLFNPDRPPSEWRRAGQVLFYSAAFTNLLALALYAAWVEFNFIPWLLVMALVTTMLSGIAAFLLFKRQSPVHFVAWLPALLTVFTLVVIALTAQPEQALYYYFFLPGSLALVAASLLLRHARHLIS